MSQVSKHLPQTEFLSEETEWGGKLLNGLSELLDEELAKAEQRRCDSPLFNAQTDTEHQVAVLQLRQQLGKSIGLQDSRMPFSAMELLATTNTPALIAETSKYTVHAVRWPVLAGVEGEGLLLRPKGTSAAHAIALPDADWAPELLAGVAAGIPESSQFARHLAEAGLTVVVPVLVDRSDTWSGHPDIRMTNQPHREWIYRMAFVMGRHIIGYEVQKILALVDYFKQEAPDMPVGVYGYGEGGLLALHAAAFDERIDVAAVSGYFHVHRRVWLEPIYRNVWRRCKGLTDAELAAAIAPRALILEASPGPVVAGPPPESKERKGAAPGILSPVPPEDIEAEATLARQAYLHRGHPDRFILVTPSEAQSGPGTNKAITAFLSALGVASTAIPKVGADTHQSYIVLDEASRQIRLHRQIKQLCDYTQALARKSENVRRKRWSAVDMNSLAGYQRTTEELRTFFWDEVVGRWPLTDTSPQARSRLIEDQETYELYEVVLQIWPNTPTLGYFLLPKGIHPGEKRPVVVCQHGAAGKPSDTFDENSAAYHGFTRRLAERGYIVYAPQSPFIGYLADTHRKLQLKANTLGLSMYAANVAQNQRILEWLAQLPFVDADRIGYYGLSYGGKTAMRVTALLPQYRVSICSGDFNEYILKNTSTDLWFSFMFTADYQIFDFDSGNTFNYAEMAWLICPRPFMVERGHHDGVSQDEYVAYEYAKVRRHYADLGIPDCTEIEFFQGGHEIHATGTFAFLDRYL